MDLKDKKVFVTGGSRGIGKEIVLTCLREGADVHFLSTRPSESWDEMKAVADETGVQVVWHEGSVTDEEKLVVTLKEVFDGGIDLVVNNAGIIRDGLIFRMKTEQFNEVLNVNLTGAFIVAREAAAVMIRQRKGAIVNISSVVGLIGNAGQTNYSASKAGLIGFTKSLAREVATRGVRVNAIAPGFIRTEMTDSLKDSIKEAMLSQVPLGVLGEAKNVADAVVFLGSEKSAYMTGQVLTVDGGMVM